MRTLYQEIIRYFLKVPLYTKNFPSMWVELGGEKGESDLGETCVIGPVLNQKSLPVSPSKWFLLLDSRVFRICIGHFGLWACACSALVQTVQITKSLFVSVSMQDCWVKLLCPGRVFLKATVLLAIVIAEGKQNLKPGFYPHLSCDSSSSQTVGRQKQWLTLDSDNIPPHHQIR